MEIDKPTTKRNDPCHCASGKKYKKCCLDKDSDTPQQVTHNGYCCITRRATNIKWKGNFISRDLLFHAKRIKEENKYTMREAIQTIQNRYSHFLVGKSFDNAKQLSKIVREFISDLNRNPLGDRVGGYRA